MQGFRTGTAFPNFDVRGMLASFIIVVPPQPLAVAFDRFFALTRRTDLIAQSLTLAALRDVLRPRIISGVVRLAETMRVLETVT
jgi:hypothetical protein